MNYDDYAKLFDKVFPLNEVTLSFLKEEFKGKRDILDLGCGRGLYTNALASDFNVVGKDISQEMIKSAKEEFPNLEFSVEDMRCFTGIYQGIFIIGNTLVHLTSYEDIKEECKYLYNHLESGGKLVIQIINYDRIYKFQIDHLPEINKDGIHFIRNYQLEKDKVIFNSTLIYKGMSQKQSVFLYPLRLKELENILIECGFKDIKFYDGFKRQSFLIDSSIQLVVTANKE